LNVPPPPPAPVRPVATDSNATRVPTHAIPPAPIAAGIGQ
jgi:hypothetical protein